MYPPHRRDQQAVGFHFLLYHKDNQQQTISQTFLFYIQTDAPGAYLKPAFNRINRVYSISLVFANKATALQGFYKQQQGNDVTKWLLRICTNLTLR